MNDRYSCDYVQYGEEAMWCLARALRTPGQRARELVAAVTDNVFVPVASALAVHRSWPRGYVENERGELLTTPNELIMLNVCAANL